MVCGWDRWVGLMICAVAAALPATGQVAARSDGSSLVRGADPLGNPWPEDWEDAYRARGEAVLRAQCATESAKGLGGRTYFENEKRAYGYLLAHMVAGDRDVAIRELQREDAQAKAWHSHTEGIDYYACFTLKHQMRKYFLFADLFEPAYRGRMVEGARRWTELDPLRRPHPAYQPGGQGWGPDVKNSWVDVRTTENLFLMRVSSVYLMAEETGNEQTRRAYRRILLDYAASLFRVGMGEWDSENYHGHCMPPLLNLYDFAKDDSVRASAKAALDYLCAVGAVKYYRGAFNGPGSRDYNHPQPFGGSAPCMLWLYFGDCPVPNPHFESDEVHVLTSGYRPPAAVVSLARKRFVRPAELISTKPVYAASTTRDWSSEPAYLETHYFGRTFQLGSLVGGTPAGFSAANGFKILVWDPVRGAVAIQGIPGPDPSFPGSSLYKEGKVTGENRVAQYRDLAIWLVRRGDAPWVWTLPNSIAVEQGRGITFLRADQTWLALRPINLTSLVADTTLTADLHGSRRGSAWGDHQVLSARGRGGAYCGVAIEIGEAPAFSSFDAFREAVHDRSRLEAGSLSDGLVSWTGSSGRSVQLQFADTAGETIVWRDGVPRDGDDFAPFVYRSDEKGPIDQERLSGRITVRAGGAVFEGTVSEQGRYTFANR